MIDHRYVVSGQANVKLNRIRAQRDGPFKRRNRIFWGNITHATMGDDLKGGHLSEKHSRSTDFELAPEVSLSPAQLPELGPD